MVRRWAGALGIVWVLTTIVLASCRQIVGVGDSPVAEPASTTVCGLPYATASCASCAQTSCCEESTACAGDAVCELYERCLGGCAGDPACRSRCTIKYPVPAPNAGSVAALGACLARRCGGQCGLTCGGFAGNLSMPDAAAECATCLQKSTCTEESACAGSADCDAFWRCYLACPTPDCQTTCVSAYDAGAALFQPLYQGFSGTCAKACGYGSYWACLPKASWPTNPRDRYTWTEWVYDWQSRSGIAGAEVSFCTACPCPTPTNEVLATGTTDPDGYVTLEFPIGKLANGQGLTYCEQTTASGYITNLAYGGFPASAPAWSVHGLLPPVAWGIAMLTPQAQQANDMTVKATFDTNRSIFVTAGVFDCLGSPTTAGAAEVTINVRDPQVLPYNPTDAGPDALPTATTGAAGSPYSVVFFDVPADAGVTVSAIVPGLGPVSQVSANLAPDTITQVGLTPTPIP